MREKHLPLLEAALRLEGRVYETVFHAGVFGATEDMASYSASRIRFAEVRETAEAVAELASSSPGGSKVSRAVESLDGAAHRLGLALEKQRTLADASVAGREKLRKTADELGEILLALQAGAASSPPENAGKPEAELDAKARLLALNEFALAVESVAGQAAALSGGRFAGLAAADEHFGKRWQEAKEACRAAGPDVFGRMEKAVASYREFLAMLRFTLEEGERLAGEREEAAASLVAVAGEVTALERAAMAADVERAYGALSSALFFGGAFFLLALAFCAACLYFSSVTKPAM